MDTRRAVSFMMRSRMLNAEQFEEARQILRDIDSLDSHTAFLFDKINFLMDATVGFININQNKIIKIFSVASVALLPPTLIASIYGMNFKAMPELDWALGYPFALGADGGLGGGAVHLLPPQGLAALAARRLAKRCAGRGTTGAARRGRKKKSRSAPGGTREEEGGGEPSGDFSRHEPAGSATETGSTCRSRPSDRQHVARIRDRSEFLVSSRRLERLPDASRSQLVRAGGRRAGRARGAPPRARRGKGSPDYTRADFEDQPMLYPELFKQLEAVRWNMDTGHSLGPVRRRAS